MELGSQFVTWCPYRGWVAAEVVWTGAMPFVPPSDVSMTSSLVDGYGGAAPAKPNGPAGSGRASRGSGLVSQTAMRA